MSEPDSTSDTLPGIFYFRVRTWFNFGHIARDFLFLRQNLVHLRTQRVGFSILVSKPGSPLDTASRIFHFCIRTWFIFGHSESDFLFWCQNLVHLRTQRVGFSVFVSEPGSSSDTASRIFCFCVRTWFTFGHSAQLFLFLCPNPEPFKDDQFGYILKKAGITCFSLK